jgi:hypothetical protein
VLDEASEILSHFKKKKRRKRKRSRTDVFRVASLSKRKEKNRMLEKKNFFQKEKNSRFDIGEN